MNTFNRHRCAQHGFSLLETLVAVVVVAVGLLAVASLQSNLVGKSADNKAQTEAMAIAQARLDQFRNYTNTLSTEAGFNALFADTSGNYTNPTTIDGVNAAFTRAELIAAGGNTKDISVQVGWNDRHGELQTVVMSTSLGWQPPRAAGDLGYKTRSQAVPSPVGRAHLGRGQLPTGAPTTSNGDGTDLYDDGSGQLMLVVGSDIVLTLEDACQSGGGNCNDFATINGRIYIDTGSHHNMAPGEVFITATNATYCQRYYIDSNGVTVTVTNATTSTPTTPNGDYEYFDYTCYLGGGWHGNIGVLLAGGTTASDKSCQGDPTSANLWEQPVIAARRIYRGMLYKINVNNASGKEEDADGNVLYYSIGVPDAKEFPDPNTSDKTHDFVVASMPSSVSSGSNCTSLGVMVRTDSYVGGIAGALFAGMPTDFVCLNPNNIDSYDSSVFGVDSGCPYNPADPPASGYVLSGTLTVTADSGDAAEVDLITMNTSDGLYNCVRGAFTESGGIFTAPYGCTVFDWGSGWNGYIEASSSYSNTFCFDDGADGDVDSVINLSGISGDATGKDYSCLVGTATLIRGTATTANSNKVLAGATISEAGGMCTVEADGLSYSCFTGVYATSDWTGTITFTTTGGNVCGVEVDVNTGIATFTNEAPGNTSRDLYISNNTNCP